MHPQSRAFLNLILMFVFATLAERACDAQQVQAQQASSVIARASTEPDTYQIDAAIKLAQESLQHLQENVNDYTALFVKRCRVNGELPPMQYARVKIRNRKNKDGRTAIPLSVYLNFLKPTSVQGREIIWVEGRNDGKMVVHETGIGGLININLDPNGALAMRGQRYPITDIGIENLVRKMIETGIRDRQYGECNVQFFENAKIGKVTCMMLQVTHPIKRDHFDFYQARLYFDQNLKVPIRYESWSWPTTPGGKPVLEEEYMYLQLAVNVGLSDQDFDIANPSYRFR
jgi:hypothetical protein